MQSFIDTTIALEGWSPWAGTFGPEILYFGEYQNIDLGSNMAQRVNWREIQKITPQIAYGFTVAKYLVGDEWIKSTGVQYATGMMKV